MNSLEEKIRTILSEVSDGKGFDFAAIIEREDAGGRWDLVLSTDRIKDWSEEKTFIETIAPILSKELSDKELINLGIIEMLNPESEFMQEYNHRLGPTLVDRDYFNITIAGIPVRHAHVFGSESPLVFA